MKFKTVCPGPALSVSNNNNKIIQLVSYRSYPIFANILTWVIATVTRPRKTFDLCAGAVSFLQYYKLCPLDKTNSLQSLVAVFACWITVKGKCLFYFMYVKVTLSEEFSLVLRVIVAWLQFFHPLHSFEAFWRVGPNYYFTLLH